jgi:TetR/AcrR family transcriptional regulator, regulator of cefoperazone and chloramphenicol sensitivity
MTLNHLPTLSVAADGASHRLAPGRHDKSARQQALVDAASAVFAEQGFDAATTREIAERAACAEGLIHRYFGGKQGLLLAVLERKVKDLTAEYCASAPDRASLAEEIEGLLLFPLQAIWERQEVLRVAVAQATTGVLATSTVARTISARLQRERAALIATKLQAHREAGTLDAHADIDAAAEMIAGLGFFFGFTRPIVMNADRALVESHARSAARIIALGLAPTA